MRANIFTAVRVCLLFSVVFFGLLPSSAKPVTAATVCLPPPSGLTAWWPGDGNANDIVGSNNGTLQGATFTTGEVGQAFSLDGVDDYVSIPDSPSLNVGTGDFSLDGWIQPSTTATFQTIVDKRQKASTSGYHLWTEGQSLGLQMADSLGAVNFFTNVTVQDGRFHHIAATVVRSSTTGGHLYVDGQVVLTFDPTPKSGSLDNTSEFRLGAHLFTYPAGSFQGAIDEFDLFKRALSASEVAAIYSAGSAGKCKASLTVSPPSGIFGQAIHFTGTGFGPSETVNVYLDSIGTTPAFSTTSAADGSVVLTGTVPQAILGTHNLIAVGQTSSNEATAAFTVKPGVRLHADRGPNGTLVTAVGYGYGNTETVTLHWKTIGGLQLGSSVANALGSVTGSRSITFLVPQSTPGTYRVYVEGSVSGAIAFDEFTVN